MRDERQRSERVERLLRLLDEADDQEVAMSWPPPLIGGDSHFNRRNKIVYGLLGGRPCEVYSTPCGLRQDRVGLY